MARLISILLLTIGVCRSIPLFNETLTTDLEESDAAKAAPVQLQDCCDDKTSVHADVMAANYWPEMDPHLSLLENMAVAAVNYLKHFDDHFETFENLMRRVEGRTDTLERYVKHFDSHLMHSKAAKNESEKARIP